MRRLALPVLLFALAFTCAAAREETVEQLKSRFQNASLHLEDRPALAMRIAQRQLLAAGTFYRDGNAGQARAAVEDIVAYSEKARDAATQTGKHLKSVEINVRRMAVSLGDIKRTLAFDDQAPVDQAIRRLEDVRTTLLKAMFAKDNKKEKQ
jgi:hypothetical protein